MAVMGAWGTAMPLQDLMGYTRTDVTVAAGALASAPPGRSEERNEAALSIGGQAGRAPQSRVLLLQVKRQCGCTEQI